MRGARSAPCRGTADGDATRPGPPARGAADHLSPQQGLFQLSRRLLQGLGERGQGQLFLEGRGHGVLFITTDPRAWSAGMSRGGERPTAAWGPRERRHPTPRAQWVPDHSCQLVEGAPGLALGTADGQTPR